MRRLVSRSCSLRWAQHSPITARTSQKQARIDKRAFGKLPDGTTVDIYTLKNSNGLEVEITNYGGAVVAIKTPDRRGRMA